MSDILISIIIPVYNDRVQLKYCLEALEEQKTNEDYEILVVDNDSEDDILGITKQYPNVRYLSEKKVGSYAARNCGVKNATGKYIAFTDADCVPDEYWIREGVNFLNKNTSCEAVGGNIKFFYNSEKPNGVELYDSFTGFKQEKTIKKFQYSVTGNIFVRKECFVRYGLFNEELKSGGDVAWCQNLVKKGGKICYNRNAIVFHPALDSFKKFKRKHTRIAGGKFQRKGFTFYKLLQSSYHHLLSIKPFIEQVYDAKEMAGFINKGKAIYYHLLKIIIYILTYFKIYLGGRPKRK